MSNTTSPRTFTDLQTAQANPRHGQSRDGQPIQWDIWEIEIADTIEPGTYYIWSNCSHVALEQVAKDALPITVSRIKENKIEALRRAQREADEARAQAASLQAELEALRAQLAQANGAKV